MIPDPADSGLLEALPAFRRARGYRLYDGSGRRYLDLWQADGHALLGHRPAGVTKLMKGSLSRGLLADLPSARAGRLARALRSHLPGHPHIRLYTGLGRCLEVLSAWQGGTVRAQDIRDPVDAGSPAELPGRSMAVWRPSVDMGDLAKADVLLPVLPFGMGGCPWALCFRDDPGSTVAPTEPISAAILEGATAAVHLLGRYLPGAICEQIRDIAPPAWRTVGPYLCPRFARDDYEGVFRRFLERGVVLSPRFDCASTLPAEASDGERAALVELLGSVPLE